MLENKILTMLDYLLCLLLAVCFTGAQYYLYNDCFEITFAFYGTAAVIFVVFCMITWSIRKYLTLADYKRVCKKKILCKFENMMKHRWHVLIVSCIIFFCWLPALGCLYPGTVINDTWGQLQQFMNFVAGNGGLSDHHPVFDTFLMGGLIVPLAELTGRWHIVMFIYVLLQSYITSLAFACTVAYVYKRLDIGTYATLGILAMYCILPLFPISVQTISKDAIFSWIFVFFTICFVEIIRTEGNVLSNRKFLVLLSIITILCCLTKKTGLYVILLSLCAVLVFQKKNRLYTLIPMGGLVLVMFVIMPCVYNGMNIEPGGKQEMFSIPFQQTARYVKYYEDDMSAYEREVIDKVLTINDLGERYNPYNADPVKNYYQKGSDQDYIEYIKVWIKQGIRHPGAYISAFNCMLAGWFSWTEYDPLMSMEWHSQLDTAMIPEWVPVRNASSVTAEAFQKIYHNLYSFPIVKVFFSYGLYSALIPAFVLGTACRKWKNREVKYWIAILPMLFSIILGCWLAPVSTHFEGRRYLYPVTYTIPLMISWCIYIYKYNKEI